ncbi:unnamed protein product, partial [Polarella glacialis]
MIGGTAEGGGNGEARREAEEAGEAGARGEKAVTDNEEPSLAIPYTDRQEPNREKQTERSSARIVSFQSAHVHNEEPSLAVPCTDRLEPNQAKLRKDNEFPKCTTSKADNEEPNRAKLRTDNELQSAEGPRLTMRSPALEPNRAKLRQDNEQEPNREKLRKDNELPKCTKSTTDTTEPSLAIPYLPKCTTSKTDNEEPSLVIPYTDRLEPNRANLRKGSISELCGYRSVSCQLFPWAHTISALTLRKQVCELSAVPSDPDTTQVRTFVTMSEQGLNSELCGYRSVYNQLFPWTQIRSQSVYYQLSPWAQIRSQLRNWTRRPAALQDPGTAEGGGNGEARREAEEAGEAGTRGEKAVVGPAGGGAANNPRLTMRSPALPSHTLTGRLEPNRAKLRKGNEFPKRTTSKADHEEPNRAKLRTDDELPKCTRSKTDHEEPSLAILCTDRLEPNRAKLRKDNEQEPNREKLRKDNELPKCTKSTT